MNRGRGCFLRLTRALLLAAAADGLTCAITSTRNATPAALIVLCPRVKDVSEELGCATNQSIGSEDN